MRDTQREAETEAEGCASPCREPYVGLDPRTPASWPEPKAVAQPLSHPGAPNYVFYKNPIHSSQDKYQFSHFTNEETKAQRGYVVSPVLHS